MALAELWKTASVSVWCDLRVHYYCESARGIEQGVCGPDARLLFDVDGHLAMMAMPYSKNT